MSSSFSRGPGSLNRLPGILVVGTLALGFSGCGERSSEPNAASSEVADSDAALPGTLEVVETGTDDAPRYTFNLTGLPQELLERFEKENEDISAWFRVTVSEENETDEASDRPAMLGEYAVVGDAICFTPRFPPVPGLRYTALYQPAELLQQLGREADSSTTVTAAVLCPLPSSEGAPRVTHVYPSDDTLPENLLKFYLHFSEPMNRGEVYKRVHLIDADGKEVELPFLELEQELWNPEQTRLTLLLDPGRIKRGLKPNELVGRAIVRGGEYTLRIDAQWVGAEGRELQDSYEKRFRAVPMDETVPDVTTWKTETPSAGTREPLRLRFPEPLDHALLSRVLTVVDATGTKLSGIVATAQNERLWEFVPAADWTAGPHAVEVETILEDLAGNSLGRPFEVDETKSAVPGVARNLVRVEFTIASPK